MLQFVLGRAGAGKSTLLLEQIAQENTTKPVYLLVPEQFSFEMEKKAYRALGAKRFGQIHVMSFGRLVYHVLKQFGDVCGVYADDLVKHILMHQTLGEMGDTLTFYQKSAKSPTFPAQALSLLHECKHAQVTPEALKGRLVETADSMLLQKLSELEQIFSYYEALLASNYLDNLDDVSRAVLHIKAHNVFDGSLVFIDEFKSFTQSEWMLIEWMLRQSSRLTLSLCSDYSQLHKPNSLFYIANQTFHTLKGVAKKHSVSIQTPIVLEKTHRFFSSAALAHLEREVFQMAPKPFLKEQCDIVTVVARQEYDEVEYVAATISQLAKEGYRYRDIVVVARELSAYQNALQSVFARYDIPVFLDSVSSITHMPLVRLICLCFEVVLHRFQSEHLVALLKCGLCAVPLQDIAELENYIYLWDIDKEDWLSEFTLHTYGARLAKDEQEQALDAVRLVEYNQVRERLTGAFLPFADEIKNASVKEIVFALKRLLDRLMVFEHLKTVIASLEAQLDDATSIKKASQYRRVWEICFALLQKMIDTIGDKPIAPAQFLELFFELCAVSDIGTIPETLDSVMAGETTRMRTEEKKVVFVLGVTHGVFPHVPQGGSLLSDKERSKLRAAGIMLGKDQKEKILEEKMIAYQIMTMPSKRLYLCAASTDITGSELQASLLFSQMEQMFGSGVQVKTTNLSPLYFCHSDKTVFWQLAKEIKNDTPLAASLAEYFAGKKSFQSRKERLENLQYREPFRLHHQENIKKLYGNELHISPSRVEDFTRCPFFYFCKHGMKILPREKTSLAAQNRGLILHEVLYSVCRKMVELATFDEKIVKQLIKEAFDLQLAQLFGGREKQSPRFVHLYFRMQQTVFSMLRQLFLELSQSKFHPMDFEYKIGQNQPTKALQIRTDDHYSLSISGQIDRIDVYDSPTGKRYVRVVDYKSGPKSFCLSDVCNGTNLQMLIYLLCLAKQGGGAYRDITPAGMLYLPIGEMALDLGRESNDILTAQKADLHYRMSGLLLDDEVALRAMEENLRGKYIPLKAKKDAYDEMQRLKQQVFLEQQTNPAFFERKGLDTVVSNFEITKIFAQVERILKQMASDVFHGKIQASPLKEQKQGGLDPCGYCDYKGFCGFSDSDTPRLYLPKSKQEVLSNLIENHDKDATKPQ